MIAAVLVVLIALSAAWTPGARAVTDLETGQVAVIAEAQGDPVRLRAEPGLDGAIVDQFSEGTEVIIRGGLTEADDGSLWYPVEIGGDAGYMIADYLYPSGFAGASGSATVTSSLNLRAGPSTSDDVLAVMPEGATVEITGASRNGFAPVAYDGMDGWAYAQFLVAGAVEQGSVDAGVAVTTSELNLRAGPSTSDDVLLVMPEGAEVALTGDQANGFYGVEFDGESGWASADYLDLDGGSAPASDRAVVDSALNLRNGPSTGDDVLAVMPGGAEVAVNGAAENGFYPVSFNGQEGWAFGEFLLFEGEAVAEADDSAAIVWPVSGGEWTISQGYNGFSHYNGGGGYQYQYAFDLARTDGGTAWQPAYSPVSGVVRWTEAASGGITIDMGNGYAVAIFHLTLDGWNDGDTITQGDYLGTISGPGGAGYVDNFAHLHISVWQTTDGGNWSRIAVPFTGVNAISGQEFPASGSYSEWAGTIIYP